ncbi:MAG: Asp-tRNA(Asn)/Glu-tRNA(Gln) amidotransferase subunit GatC [bacterium]
MSNKKISKESIEHLANLSKLKIAEEKSEKFSSQIDSILDYVDQISGLDVKEDFKSQTDLRSIMREDVVSKCLEQKDAISGRKESQIDGYFIVKSVLKK